MRQIRAFFRNMWSVSPSRNIAGQCIDLLMLKLFLNTGPRDYYFYEFYKQELTWEQKSRYASSRGSRYWIFENNPFKYQVLFTDKFVQKMFLTGLKLPTSKVIALIGGGGAVSSLSEFQKVVEQSCAEFVLKPVSARGGDGFRRLVKGQDKLFEGENEVQIEDIWNELKPTMERGVVMEETVHNHKTVESMNPSSLNTFRVMTFRFPDGRWESICICLKVGRLGSVVDNRTAGGLLVPIDKDGRTGTAFDTLTNTSSSQHPDSGAQLANIKLEMYQDVVDLAIRASAYFSHTGILGWDIALTPDGPVIIEVNAAPSVKYLQVVYGGIVTDEMAQVLKPRNLFSRYPRTHYYPNHLIDRKGRV